PTMDLRSTVPFLALLPALVACTAGAGESPARRERAGSSESSRAEQELRRAMADSASWPSYGRDQSNQRYSPLSQIGTGNVGRLRLACSHTTGTPNTLTP